MSEFGKCTLPAATLTNDERRCLYVYVQRGEWQSMRSEEREEKTLEDNEEAMGGNVQGESRERRGKRRVREKEQEKDPILLCVQ